MNLNAKAAEIRAGLDWVTPGPWMAFSDEPKHRHYGRAIWISSEGRPSRFLAAAANGPIQRHIARLDPQTVLALLDEREALREALRAARDCVQEEVDARGYADAEYLVPAALVMEKIDAALNLGEQE